MSTEELRGATRATREAAKFLLPCPVSPVPSVEFHDPNTFNQNISLVVESDLETLTSSYTYTTQDSWTNFDSLPSHTPIRTDFERHHPSSVDSPSTVTFTNGSLSEQRLMCNSHSSNTTQMEIDYLEPPYPLSRQFFKFFLFL